MNHHHPDFNLFVVVHLSGGQSAILVVHLGGGQSAIPPLHDLY